jgi:thiol:disulfide interchange protein DsbD
MKALILISLLGTMSSAIHAQVFDPVHWSFSVKHVSGDEYDLIFNARMDKGWHIYGQDIDDGGPVPTSFTFEEGGHFTAEGSMKESDNAKTAHDKIFEMTLIKFSEYATFTQRVKWTNHDQPIAGYLTFMTCDHERCLAPKDVDFTFKSDK